MTPTRSGSNYSIQSNGSGPGNSSHKSNRKEPQPRGEAHMEDSRTSTSSQRPESLSTGNNRDIPVSIQELVYGSKTARVGTSPKSLYRHLELISSSEEFHGSRQDRRTSEGLDTNFLQRTSPTDKSLVQKPKHVIRGPEEEVGPREGKQPSGSSPSLNKCQTSPRKPQVEQALPTELQDSQERGDSHGQCAQYGKNSNGIQKQGRGKIEPIISKEVDLVQNLENSTRNNAALFQEQLKKSDKARLELKEDIQSSINNISLKNDFPRKSTPILDRNALSLNNDLNHTVSSNAEVETASNFEEISILEEWPTFSGEGEYNHIEFMKTIDMLKESFNIPDEYISARLHSLFTKSAKKLCYIMRQDHGKHSWPWWKEQIISKWANDSWRFKMENSFEEAIFNIERDRPMSWFLNKRTD
ncbi:hypothetical protein O181_087726 [Austropuccinia psidii MF-1]|uniref:Uncharacterized protein n=1 Tax=Austropuccinia psidii MF-1 TaxID=1389203 RepID=A0A9Q3IQ71_9BASI|nr:hypothetical protein [Austropuccinia psidii MF-1]